MRLLAHEPMSSAMRAGTNPGSFNEVAIGTNIAVVANFGPERTFSVVNVSDPLHPRHVGDWWASDPLVPTRLGATSAWGIAIYPEDDLVIVSVQAMANPAQRDQVGGGLFVVNLDDPAKPREESYQAVADDGALIRVGVHTVRVFSDNETRYVAASTANGKTLLFEVVGQKPQRTLKYLAEALGMHDTTVQVHPITGQRILYGARGGVALTDISDVSKPQLLSQTPATSYHQVVPSDVLIDGRHYTVSATESAEGLPTPFTLLDTTDPTEPVVVGRWKLPLVVPGERTSGSPYRYTGHNLDFDRGRLYIGHSHAGVWVVDVSSEANVKAPFPIAFYQPNKDPLRVPFNPFSAADVPAVWSAYRHDSGGYVYVSDCNTGLYILEVTEPPSPLESARVWPHNTG
jgi:hypothetical protein